MKNKTLTINKQVQWHEKDKDTGESGFWYFTPPKYNSIRTIEMPSDLTEVLKREKERQDKAVSLYKELYTEYYVDDNNKLNTECQEKKINLVMIRLDGTYIISRK